MNSEREALKLLARGEAKAALSAIDEVPKKDPRLLCHRARILFDLGRDEEALETSGRALDGTPSGSRFASFVMGSRAILLADFGRHEEAIPLFAEATRLDPKNRLLPGFLGVARFGSGARREGIANIKNSLYGASPRLSARIALMLEAATGIGEATFAAFVMELFREPEWPPFEALNKLLLLPDRMANWLHGNLFARGELPVRNTVARAATLVERGDLATAKRLLEEAIALQEAKSEVRSLSLRQTLGEVELMLRHGEEAEALLEDETDEYERALRGAAFFLQGKAEEALEILRGLPPEPSVDDFSILYLKGLCHLAAGQKREARLAMEEAFRLPAPYLIPRLLDEAGEMPS